MVHICSSFLFRKSALTGVVIIVEVFAGKAGSGTTMVIRLVAVDALTSTYNYLAAFGRMWDP